MTRQGLEDALQQQRTRPGYSPRGSHLAPFEDHPPAQGPPQQRQVRGSPLRNLVTQGSVMSGRRVVLRGELCPHKKVWCVPNLQDLST